MIAMPKAPTYVYAAYRSVPDFHARPPAVHSLHLTLDGAIKSLYPDRPDFQQSFRKVAGAERWEGPDGFGSVERVEVVSP